MKAFKTKLDIENLAMREIIRRATPHVYSESFIGCGHFLIEKEHAGIIGHIVEEYDDDDIREKDDETCKRAFPKEIEQQFFPTRHSTKLYNFVTDEKKVFSDKYYWLLCEKMGFTIHGGDDHAKPHSLVKDGKIVGVCMLMQSDVLDKEP